MTARRLLAAAFGTTMTGAAALGSDGAGLFAAAIALIAVLAGLCLRPAATVAVLAAACAVALADPRPTLAAVAGVCAAAYLVLMHAPITRPTAVGIVGFAVAGVVATTLPAGLPWLPLAAPVAVVLAVGVALGPFFGAAD